MDKMKSLLNKNKLVLLVLSVITLLLIIGTSLAFYQMVNTQTGENLVETGCFDVRITNQENAINLENAYPISDEKGKSLTPFTFTLANNCNVTGKYTVNLEVLKDSTMSPSFIKTLVNNGTINKLDTLPKAETKNSGSIEARTLTSGILTPNSSVDYSVSLWMDENVTIEDGAMGTVLKSKIVVVSTPTDIKPKTEEIIAELDKTGKCPTVNEDGTVTVTDTEDTTGYLCSAPDNYGTSYYYRGNVENNYVKLGTWSDDTADVVYGFEDDDSYGGDGFNKFMQHSSLEECKNSYSYNNNCTLYSRKGKDMYWRIVRINGDGTVRLIYDGTSPNSNNAYEYGIIGPNLSDITEYDNYISYISDNAGVGYMYGNPTETILSTKTEILELSLNDKINVNQEYTYKDGYFEIEYNPIEVSTLNEQNIGNFTFGDSSTSGSGTIYKITNIIKDTEKVKIEYKLMNYGTTSKENAQTNNNDSKYKRYIDSWYENNVRGKQTEQYLTDNIFCNNRLIGKNKLGDFTTNLGFGPEETVYGFGDNISDYLSETMFDENGNNDIKVNKINSSLKCGQQNDSFTVKDKINGNGALTYPTALLTLDEAVLAGGYFDKINSKYYLNRNSNFMTMTPLVYSERAFIGSVSNNGKAYVGFDFFLRPVINVKASTLLYGDGTISNPYRPIE